MFPLTFVQLLVMESERFSIPEVLFQPQLVGLNQAGIGEALAQAYERLQNQVHAHMSTTGHLSVVRLL